MNSNFAKRRLVVVIGILLLFFVAINLQNSWYLHPEDDMDILNMTLDMKSLVLPDNVTTVLTNQETCHHRPQKLSPVSSSPAKYRSSNSTTVNTNEDHEESLFLLVAVCSSVTNFDARMAIRETWGKKGSVFLSDTSGTGRVSNLDIHHYYTSDTSIGKNNSQTRNISDNKTKEVANASVRVIFMLGRTSDASTQALLEQEHLQHGDLVQEDFADTYKNLTIKSVMFLKWVNNNCRGVSYVMKTDDDTFVNIPRLVRHLQTHGRTNLLLGCLICHARPIRDRTSKWYVPRSLFDESVYPNYLSGSGYVISGDLVPRLYEEALRLSYFHMEDVFVTGLSARNLNVNPVDHEGFTHQRRKPNPCQYHFGITGHRLTSADFRDIWRQMWEPSLNCNRETISLRDFYDSNCI